MPFKCCVPKCNGNYYNGPKVNIFKFPENEEEKNNWLRNIKREGFLPTANHRVCEQHFHPDDIVREISAVDDKSGKKMTAKLKRPYLKDNAIPTLFPNYTQLFCPTEIRRESPDSKKGTEEAPFKAVYIMVPSYPSTSVNESSNLHWSRKDTTWLIDMYRQQPCLWNVKREDYKDRKKRLAALTAIKLEMQKKHAHITIKDIKKKLDTLRSQYRREMRQLENTRKSGVLTDDIYSPKFWCFGYLSFLTDGDTMRTSPSSINPDTLKEAVEENLDHEVTRKNKAEGNLNAKDKISFAAGPRLILPKKHALTPTQGLMNRDSEGLHSSGSESEGSLRASESPLIISGKHKKKSGCVNQGLTLVTDSMHPLQNDSRQEYNSDSTSLKVFSVPGITEEQADFSHLCSDQDIPVEESNLTTTSDKLQITKEIKVTNLRDSLQEEVFSSDNNGLTELTAINSQPSGKDTYGKRKRRRNESYNEPGDILGTDEAYVKTCKDQIEADSCDAFGRYIALQLKQLPIENALNLQMVIHNLVAQERLKVQQKEVSMKKRVIKTKATDDQAFGIHGSVKESSTNEYYVDNSIRKEPTVVKYNEVNEKSNDRPSSVKKTSKIECHNEDSIQVNVPRKSTRLSNKERLPLRKSNQESSIHSSFAEDSLGMTVPEMRQSDTFAENSPGMTAAGKEQHEEAYNFENQSLLNITIDKQELDDDDFSYWDAPSPVSVKSEAESISSG